MHWLSRYGTTHYQWQRLSLPSTLPTETWYRPIGLVETMFDNDGTELEGRADINTHLEAELCTNSISSNNNRESNLLGLKAGTNLRRKILLAWTVLRFRHVLLSARAMEGRDFLSSGTGDGKGGEDESVRQGWGLGNRFFVVTKPRDVDEMINEATRTIEFVGDYYSDVDVADFYIHMMNTARVFDAGKNLARLFILPLQPVSTTARGKCCFRFHAISAVAHETADALSIYRYHAQFLDLLNTPVSTLEAQIADLCSPSADLHSRLPEAQEDLYPPVPGNAARQRWFWAISRILRHVRRPPPRSFPNPLRRQVPLRQAEAMPPRYPAVLDYSRTPPLNTYPATATLSPTATSRLHALCRSAGVSVGSGTFALTAIVMMMLHERKQQQTQPQQNALADQLPFVASFPLNPRPFLARPTPPSTSIPGTSASESSLILSFCDGLTLPFLPSSLNLPLPSRFKLLARQADRQLKVFQKRQPRASDLGKMTTKEVLERVSTRSASQMMPQLYLHTMDRETAVRGQKSGLHGGAGPREDMVFVQGGYPVQRGMAWMDATCGISSIGDRSGLIASLPSDYRSGTEEDGKEDFATFDFRDIRCTVRVRDGEFLVGSAGDRNGLGFHVSIDGCAIDRERVGEWVELMEGLFEDGMEEDDANRVGTEGRKDGRDRANVSKL